MSSVSIYSFNPNQDMQESPSSQLPIRTVVMDTRLRGDNKPALNDLPPTQQKIIAWLKSHGYGPRLEKCMVDDVNSGWVITACFR